MDAPDTEPPPSLQSRLDDGADDAPPVEVEVVAVVGPIGDPVGLFRDLETSGHFHRDSGFGRIFHPGRVSLRENEPTDSLHVVIHGNRLAAHVDRVSPLGLRPEGPFRYSLRRAVAHNAAGVAQDLVRLLTGRQGDHRSELDCEWVWDRAHAEPDPADLLDPTASGWSVQMEARVGGSLDEARLRQALGAVLDRQGPPAGDLLHVVDCPDDGALNAERCRFLSVPVGLDGSVPMRARLARHPDGDVLMLSLNHAASDGPGALRVLRSVAAAYASGGAGDERLDFLATRPLPVRPASAPVPVWKARYLDAVESVRDLLARPARLAPDQAGDAPGYGFHLERLSLEDTRRAVDPDRPGTSRNLLVAALHLAIGAWNFGHGSPGRRIGVLVPVNLRPAGWRDRRIGNFSVTARVSTSRRHRSGPAAALAAVAAQTTRNKRTRTGIALVAALARSGLLPLWTKQSLVVLQPLTRNRLLDTAMLANLGPVDPPISFGPSAGDAIDVWFSVPARTTLSLCIGAVTVADRLHLVFRYPHRLFSPDAARRFAGCYVAQIRDVAVRGT